MILEVFDFNFKRYGVINDSSFVQYEKKTHTAGTFQINCDMSKENAELLVIDRIVWFEHDVAGIIQYKNKTKENDKLVVKGKLLEGILDWRCIKDTVDVKASINHIIERYVLNNCVEDEKRKFDNFEVIESEFEDEEVAIQRTGGSISEAIEDLVLSKNTKYDLSINVGFFPREKKIKFYVRKGLDRTIGNEEGNKIVVFSNDLKNIINSEYSINTEEYSNSALVFGEGTGSKRKSVIVNDGVERTGYDLKELYVDARDVQSQYTDDNGKEHTLTSEQYLERLMQRGSEKLGERSIIETYEGDIRNDAEVAFLYKRDYDIADKISIIDKEIGLSFNATITSVSVTQDQNGYSVTPTFGYAQPTILQILRKERR